MMVLILSTVYSKCRLKVPVESLAKAQEYFESWRDSNGVVASSELGADCGVVIEDGREIAFLSYNGRVWADRDHKVELVVPPHGTRFVRSIGMGEGFAFPQIKKEVN